MYIEEHMKKTIISAALVVASLIYVFSKNSAESVTPVAVTTTVSSNTAPVSAPVVVTKTEGAPPPSPVKSVSASGYTDGTYTGAVADAYYGNVQVEVTIQNGTITNVNFLQYPSDRSTSRYINGQATPILAQEAIKAQSASVDGVSGATDTSQAFKQSLQSALSQAKA